MKKENRIPNSNINRREFIQSSALALLAIPALGLVTSEAFGAKKIEAKSVPLPAGVTEVPATDAVATAIGYKANIKDLDYTKYPQRKKSDAKNQFCNNCALYTSVNESWGKCQMLTSGLVSSHGWCGSYSKKS